MRYALPMLFAGTLFFVGCSDPAKPKPAEDVGVTNGEQREKKEKTFSGKWLLVVSQMNAPEETHEAVIEIGREMGGSYFGKILDKSGFMFPDAKLTKTEVADNQIQLLFQINPDEQFDVRGLLDGDTIYGNAPIRGQLQPVRLVRTDESKIQESQPVPTEGAKAFEAARVSDDSFARLQQFAKQFETSPTALQAYLEILLTAEQQELDEAAVSQIIEDFLKASRRWGPRMEQNVRLDSVAILVQQKYLPDLSIKTLLPLEKEPIDEDDSDFAKRLRFYGGMARVSSIDKAARRVGAAALQEFHEENLLDHYLRVVLAKHHDQDGDNSMALRLFAELALLPDGDGYLGALSEESEQEPESAEQATARLWKSINGEAEGLDEYRDQVYESVIQRMLGASPASPPSDPAGKRVALCELFTGATCAPCVAADIATVGLEATYPRSRLIVLRYHKHIPLPDPLANADSETRFDYYGLEGTPSVILDGRQVPGIGGGFGDSMLMYERLREQVDLVIDADSKLSIRLSADAKDGTLLLDVEVKGAKDLPPTTRLRLVLAEDVIRFDASNGVRRHEMIVRYMPGGADGIAVKEGRLSYKSSLGLASIKQELIDHLVQYESGLSPFVLQQLPNGAFPVRPMDLKPLHLIAFVQDDASRKVLQVASIPVGGKLEYPADPPARSKDDADSPVEAPVPGSAAATEDRPPSAPTPKPKTGPKLIPPSTVKP